MTATSPPASPASSAGRAERYRLAGPSQRPDPRTHAYRPDIADVRLADRLFAPHYAAAVARAATGSAAVRAAPSDTARAVSQILPGEPFELLETAGGWAWGRCGWDEYVGYVPADLLGPAIAPTHRIVAARALVFAAPDIKAPVLGRLPLGARLAGVNEGAFVAGAGGYIHARHARPFDLSAADAVDVAERLLGQPYLWGGRGDGGVDCSGLVQLALSFAGIDAPRDSDQQRALGTPLADDAPLLRGDLVFFPGHVGIMADAADLIHANAHWMAVVREPLADVTSRLAPDHPQPVLARRRILP